MIYESRYWKEPLIESATLLENYAQQQTELSEEDLAKIEKEIFIGFYSIRKLMDTIAITDSTKGFQLVLVSYPNIKKVFWYNSHLYDELYDFNTENKETRSLRFVCNQIIHSYMFGIFQKEQGGFEGIVFSSDKDKDNKLYSMDTRQLVEIFRLVGNDDPVEHHIVRDPVTGEFKTTVL
jgi:hypothetical protein